MFSKVLKAVMEIPVVIRMVVVAVAGGQIELDLLLRISQEVAVPTTRSQTSVRRSTTTLTISMTSCTSWKRNPIDSATMTT